MQVAERSVEMVSDTPDAELGKANAISWEWYYLWVLQISARYVHPNQGITAAEFVRFS